ncbi:MAG: hypothetical protein ACLPVY_24495 [Acidimicrobiia bacterium]
MPAVVASVGVVFGGSKMGLCVPGLGVVVGAPTVIPVVTVAARSGTLPT